MEHYINYPEDFELTEELSNFMNKLLNILILDLVYLSKRQEEAKRVYYIITAFVDGSMDAIPHEVVCLVQRLEKEFPNFRTRIYTESICESAIGRGSLYFLEHCFLGDKLYSNPEGGTMIDDEERPLKAVLCAAERYYTSERQKVNAFIKSADELIKDKQFGIAAFNLHQAFELTFRFMEHLCLGKSRVTHSIISHIKYCKPFFPNFNLFTNAENPDNSELLILIEHAYSVSRYGDEYQIDEGQIQTMRSELTYFLETIEATYIRRLAYCKLRVLGGDSETSTIEEENLQGYHKQTVKEPIPSVEREFLTRKLEFDSPYEMLCLAKSLMLTCATCLQDDVEPPMDINGFHFEINEVLQLAIRLLPLNETSP